MSAKKSKSQASGYWREMVFRPMSVIMLGFMAAVTVAFFGGGMSVPSENSMTTAVDGASSDLQETLHDLELVNQINTGRFKPYEVGSGEINN